MLNKEDLKKTFEQNFKSILDFKKYENVFDKINQEITLATKEIRSLEEKINSQIAVNFTLIEGKIQEFKLKTQDIFQEVFKKQGEFSEILAKEEEEFEKFIDSANFRLASKKNILKEELKKNNLEFDEQIISFTDKKLKDESIVLKLAKDTTKLTDQNLKLRLNFINANFEDKLTKIKQSYPDIKEKDSQNLIVDESDDTIWFKTLVNFYNSKVKKINQEKEQAIKTIDTFFNEKITRQQKIIATIESNFNENLAEVALGFQKTLNVLTTELDDLSEKKKAELKGFEKVYFSELDEVYNKECAETQKNLEVLKIKENYNEKIANYLKTFSQEVQKVNVKITKTKEEEANTVFKIQEKCRQSVLKNQLAIKKLVEDKRKYLEEIKTYFQKTLETFDKYLFTAREFFNLNILINKNKVAESNFIQNSIQQVQELNFNHQVNVLEIKEKHLETEKDTQVFSAFSDTNLIKQSINVSKSLKLTHLNHYHSGLLNNLILKKVENEKIGQLKLKAIDLSFNLYFLNSFFKKELEKSKLFFAIAESSFVKLNEAVEMFFNIFSKSDIAKILNFDFALNYSNVLNKHNLNSAALLKSVLSLIEKDFTQKEKISDFELFEFNSYIAETASSVLSFQFKRTLDIINLQAEQILNKFIQESENWILEIKQNQLQALNLLKSNQKEFEQTLKPILATAGIDELSFDSSKEFFKAIKKAQSVAESKIKNSITYFSEIILSRLNELKKMKGSDFFDAFYFSNHFKNNSDFFFRKTMHNVGVQSKTVRGFQAKFIEGYKYLRNWFTDYREKIAKKQSNYLNLLSDLKTEIVLAFNSAHADFNEEIKADKRNLTYLKKQNAKKEKRKINTAFLAKKNNLNKKIKFSIHTLKQEAKERKNLEKLVFLNKVQIREKIKLQKENNNLNYLKKLKLEEQSFKGKLIELSAQKTKFLRELDIENQTALFRYLKKLRETKRYIKKI